MVSDKKQTLAEDLQAHRGKKTRCPKICRLTVEKKSYDAIPAGPAVEKNRGVPYLNIFAGSDQSKKTTVFILQAQIRQKKKVRFPAG